jgi:prevent-host-death family protein
MSRTIPHRELRNNSSAVLREVQHGETIEVTNHGEVVAILHPPGRSAAMRPRIRKASRRGDFREIKGVRLGYPIQPVLDELRGER